MRTQNVSWFALPLVFILTGCPSGDGGGGGGGGEAGGSAIVYLADQTTDGVFELFLASSGAKLNPALAPGGSVTSFVLTPDKTAVVYIADQTTNDVFELYRVNLATPGVSTKLNGALTSLGGDVTSFVVAPDGTSVIYLADQQIDQVFQLYQVLFATPQSSVLLNPALAVGRTVTRFAVTRDSTKVIYMGNQDSATVEELYQVALSNPLNSTKLNSPLVSGGNVTDFAITPNSAGVVYVADQKIDEVFELFLASVTGPGTGSSLNPPFVVGNNVTAFAVTPDSSAVIYRANQDNVGVVELYRVMFSAPQSSVKLNGGLIPGGNVSAFAIAPDGSAVVYRADQRVLGVSELFRVVLSSTPGAAQQLNPNYVGGQNVTNFAVTPDSSAVVYMANQTDVNVVQLYHVPFTTPQQSSPPLNGPLVSGGNVSNFAISPNSTLVVYLADQTTFGVTELFAVNVGTPGGSTKLNGLLVIPGGNVTAFTF